MMQKRFDLYSLRKGKLLILSDRKPGHLNQSIAFAKHLNCEYEIVQIAFKNRLAKAASYILDFMRVYLPFLFSYKRPIGKYSAVVSAGSATYYANKIIARSLSCPAIAIMMPKGYRLDFDMIIAQEHDNPPEKNNILTIPVNFCYVEPLGIIAPRSDERYIAFIIGGDSSRSTLNPDTLEKQMRQIIKLFPEHKIWLTTSRRTPVSIENMLRDFSYSRAVFYSAEQINPIADYLAHSDYVFLTADSSSMISEAVSFGTSKVEILPLKEGKKETGKLNYLLERLENLGCLHLFDAHIGSADKKIDLKRYLEGNDL